MPSYSRIGPAVLLALGLSAYFACLMLPLSAYTNWQSYLSPAVMAQTRKYQLVGMTALLGSTLLAAGLRGWRVGWRVSWPETLLCGLTMTWLLFSSLWSIDATSSASYAVLFGLIALTTALFWRTDATARLASQAATVTILLGLSYLAVRLHLKPRTFGNITPNLLGHFGFAAMVLACLTRSKLAPLAMLIGAALIAFAQARTVMIGAALFLLLYYVALPAIRSRRALVVAASIGGGGMAFPAAFGSSLVDLATSVTSSLLGVTDEARLGGSGFSGRSNKWQAAVDLIQDHELQGWGFRTRGGQVGGLSDALNGHSGLLNAALDIGLIGLLLFLALYGLSAWAQLRRWVDERDDTDKLGAAFLISMLPILAIEPNYLNFAHPTNFLFLLFIGRAFGVRGEDLPEPVKAAVGRRNYVLAGVGSNR
jgi:O-antigen ligase